MRDINEVLFYPSYVRSIYVPVNKGAPYNLIFYPENSSLLAGYRYLDIKLAYVRRVTYIGSNVPQLRSTRDRMKPYMNKLHLVPFAGFPPRDNIFTDCTPYLRKIDKVYSPTPYKRSDIVRKTMDYIEACANSSNLHKSVLVYYVDKTMPVIKNFMHRRALPLFRLYEKNGGEFPFHMMMFAIRFAGGIKYQMLWHAEKKRKFDINRMRQIFQSMFTFSGKPVNTNAGEFEE